MFVITGAVAVTIVPWYGIRYGYHADAWIWFAVLLSVNELSITCGYHRLFAHDTYEARPALKLFYLLFGGMALQIARFCGAPATVFITAISMIPSAIHIARVAASGFRTLAGCCAITRAANRT